MTDELLPGWLREVELSPGSQRQEAIAAAAKGVASKATAEATLDMVLLAHGVPQEDAFSQLTAAISAEDATFGGRIDDLETMIAASACVAEIMERKRVEPSAGAALAVLSAQWIGLTPPVADLPLLAQETLDIRAEAQRSRASLAVSLDLESARSSLPSFEAVQQVAPDDVSASFTVVFDALVEVKKSLERLGRAAANRVEASDEELDILWWAFSGHSERLGRPWGKVSQASAAILLGLEFVELVRYPVAPASARPILARLLGARANSDGTIAAAVKAAGKFVLDDLTEHRHMLLPVLTSIEEYRGFEGKESWRDSVERWAIQPDQTTTHLDLAEQTVREMLLAQRLS